MNEIDTAHHRQPIGRGSSRPYRQDEYARHLPAGVHGGLVVVLGALIAARIPFWPVLMLPQGS
jgi:hypothetical protein